MDPLNGLLIEHAVPAIVEVDAEPGRHRLVSRGAAFEPVRVALPVKAGTVEVQIVKALLIAEMLTAAATKTAAVLEWLVETSSRTKPA